MKTILITGCSSGMGLVAAQHLHSAGYDVIATVRRPKDAERLRDLGLTTVVMDLGDEQSVETGLYRALTLAGGSFYAVFHNAGYGQSGALEDLPVAAMVEQFNVNVFGAHAINLKLIPLMRKNGGGRIIWNSSILGFFAMKYRGAYSASKFAIEALADTLRLELVGSGIQVVLLEPGPVATAFRLNSLVAFLRHIRSESSVHAKAYEPFIARLQMPGDTSKFTLPAEACITPLMHALESPSPKHRYRITTPTKVAAILKQLLPSTLLDKVAARGF